jgi:hypothetical protein
MSALPEVGAPETLLGPRFVESNGPRVASILYSGRFRRPQVAGLVMMSARRFGHSGLGVFGRARRWALLGFALASGLSAACGRSQSNPPSGGSGGSGGAGGSNAATGGTGTGGTGTGGSATGGTGKGGTATGGGAGTVGEGGGAGIAEECTPSARVAPMRQLTRFQYDNVLRDVLGNDSGLAKVLAHDDLEVDLANDGTSDAAWVADVHGLAHDLAAASTASSAALSATLGCDLEADGEAACEARLFESILPRLLRRPLDADDLDQFEGLLTTGAELGDGDFASGVRMVLEVALQSPELLYRAELGEPLDVPSSDPRSGWSRPAPFEMASRLSFSLWGSAPDEALLAEAAAGGLRTQEEVRAAALRLLDDDRATALMRYVHLRLLRLVDHRLPEQDWDPAYTENVFLLMQSETAAFLDDVSSSGPGGFTLLLSAPYTYLNEDLAAFYGIPDVSGQDLRKVSLASGAHSGVLTQGSFLSRHSSASGTVPPFRGRAVLEAFRCAEVILHPAGLPSHAPPASDVLTTRERFAQVTEADPTCRACHVTVDPPGFALEHFDLVGRYRETEAGKPIDASAEIELDASTAVVNGAAELGSVLSQSAEANACYVHHWAAYAYAASTAAPLDECSRAQLADVFERTNGDLRALMLELTQTDAFLYLKPEEL